jgi:hypothetical protein
MPETTATLLDALAEPDRSLEHAELGARPGGATVSRIPQLFPKPQQ